MRARSRRAGCRRPPRNSGPPSRHGRTTRCPRSPSSRAGPPSGARRGPVPSAAPGLDAAGITPDVVAAVAVAVAGTTLDLVEVVGVAAVGVAVAGTTLDLAAAADSGAAVRTTGAAAFAPGRAGARIRVIRIAS